MTQIKNIQLILWVALWCAGCTNTDTPAPFAQSEHHADSVLYYDKEKDTVMTYEELRLQYDDYISLAWKAKLDGSLTDVLQHYEKAIRLNDSIQKLVQPETVQFKRSRHGLLIVGLFFSLLSMAGGALFFVWKRKIRTKIGKRQQFRIAAFKQSELYCQILQAAKDDDINISPVSKPVMWISIQENLDGLYADFTKRLIEQCPDLSETEQQICWLSKLGIQPSGIARILKLSRQAITNARSRIAKKMSLQEGETANFARFIENF